MANNNDSRPQDDALVNVNDNKEVIDSAPDTPTTAPKKEKSSGNGLLWFVVVILFLLIIGLGPLPVLRILRSLRSRSNGSIIWMRVFALLAKITLSFGEPLADAIFVRLG